MHRPKPSHAARIRAIRNGRGWIEPISDLGKLCPRKNSMNTVGKNVRELANVGFEINLQRAVDQFNAAPHAQQTLLFLDWGTTTTPCRSTARPHLLRRRSDRWGEGRHGKLLKLLILPRIFLSNAHWHADCVQSWHEHSPVPRANLQHSNHDGSDVLGCEFMCGRHD